MSEVVRLRTRAEIDEEAATWTWRLDSGALSPEDQRSFEAWLRQDPRHRRVMEELSKVWGAMDQLAESKFSDRHNAVGDGQSDRPAIRARRPAHRGRWWFAAAAAITTVCVIGTAWLQHGRELQTLSTAVGQQRNVTLADGSIVALNTNTIVETDLSRKVRQIYLRKGEAHFQVAHDRSRPFLVHAGDAVVRAVGTEFEVRLREDRHVDVLVNEGRVEVQASPMADATPSQPTRAVTVRALSAGQQLSTATVDIAVVPVGAQQLSSELAWREGAIVFDGEPLSVAVAEIGRYTDSRIVISNASVGALKVGGRFRTDDVQGFFDGLQAALPVAVRRTSDGLVYIDPR
jgi:transmembrane sensor